MDNLIDIAEILRSQKEDRIAAYAFADRLMFHDDLPRKEVIEGLFLIQKVIMHGSELSGTVAAMIDIEHRKQASKKKSFFRRK